MLKKSPRASAGRAHLCATRKTNALVAAGVWLLGGAMLLASSWASAQTVAALTDTTCAGQRSNLAGGLTPCTANDFTSSPTLTNSNGATTCLHNQYFTADLQVTLTHSAGNSRYNVGFFTGQNANNPATTTSGNICSAAAMPTSPAPWTSVDGNACGDVSGAAIANPTIAGIKLMCSGVVGSNVQVPYVVVWEQNAGTPTSCNGSIDVKTTTGSKCNGGTATISNVIVQPAADLSMQKSVQISGNQITYTLTISNAGPEASDGATWNDPVPATVAISGTPTCVTATGSSVCGTTNVSGNTVSGSVATFPANSSVTVVITGTSTNGADVTNTATVSSAPGGVTDPNTGNNSATATGASMPVTLQEFKVVMAPPAAAAESARRPR